VTDTRRLFPDNLPDIPLDDLPIPLVPGGFWEPEGEGTTLLLEDAEPDDEARVRSALVAALGVLVAKVAWVLLVANVANVPIGIRFWGNVLPYFALEVSPGSSVFTTIITTSTIGMGFAAAALMAWPMIRPGWTRLQVWGRGVALAITLETWILEAVRHVLDPPIVRWDLAWITLFEVGAGAALLSLSLKQPRSVTDRPAEDRDEPSPGTERVILEDL
jgi:hypothetical protein